MLQKDACITVVVKVCGWRHFLCTIVLNPLSTLLSTPGYARMQTLVNAFCHLSKKKKKISHLKPKCLVSFIIDGYQEKSLCVFCLEFGEGKQSSPTLCALSLDSPEIRETYV